MVLEKTLENPVDSKEVNPKGNQPRIFIGRTDPEAEADWFYEVLQDLLELTLKKDMLFIIGDWNAGETMETVRDFIFLGSRIIADSDCSYEINRHLLLRRKHEKTRQHIKKQRHHFANKVP